MNKRKLRYKRYFRDDQFPSIAGGEFWWGALLPWESLAAPW